MCTSGLEGRGGCVRVEEEEEWQLFLVLYRTRLEWTGVGVWMGR